MFVLENMILCGVRDAARLCSFYEVSEQRQTKSPIPKDKHSLGANDPENAAVSSERVEFSPSRDKK